MTSFKTNLVTACAATIMSAGTPVTAADLQGLPAAIVCSNDQGLIIIGHLSIIHNDGSAVYRSGDIVGAVDPTGVVLHADRMQATNCDGKTINELREAGQAIDFKN